MSELGQADVHKGKHTHTHKKKKARSLATLAAPHEETAEEESHGEKKHFHSNL